jgi:class 3 adenylate cyclase
VLFTDIVGSTERAGRLGDRRWGELLDVHDELARRLIEEFHGRLVHTTGDGVLATFDGPGRAIRCAADLRDELRSIGLQIRAGLHTGEVEQRDGTLAASPCTSRPGSWPRLDPVRSSPPGPYGTWSWAPTSLWTIVDHSG